MSHPRIPWTTTESFEPGWPESDFPSPDNPESPVDDWPEDDTVFWDQMIFPL